MTVKRLYIGGLFPAVTESDLKDRFSKFGAVDNVEIKIREQMEGTPVKTFAYINLTAEEPDIKKCIKTFDRTKWKGSELTIQMAKENFLSRLIKERTTPNEKSKGTDENDKMTSPKPFEREIKGPPGTKVPGEDNWVVGKYGRVLPVVNLKKEGSRSAKKIDPSKFVHNVKKLDKDTNEQNDAITVKPDELTWQLDVNENEVTRKRKGEFTDLKPKHKHRKSSQFNNSLEGDKLNGHSEYNDQQNSGRYNDRQSSSSINFDNKEEDSSEHSHKQRKSNKIKDERSSDKINQSSEDRNNINQLDKSLTPKRLANDSNATKSNKKQRKNLEHDDSSTDIGIKSPTPIQKRLLSSSLLNDNVNVSSDYSHMKSSHKLKNSRKNLDYRSSDDSDFSQHEHNQSNSQYSNSSMQKYNSLNSSGQFDNGEDTEFEVVDPDKDVASTRTRPGNISLDLKRFDSDDSEDDGNKAMAFIKHRNDRNAKQGQRQKQNRSRMEPSPKKSLASLKKFKGTKMLQESVQTVPKPNVEDAGNSKLKEGKQKEEKKLSTPSATVARRGNLPNNKMVDVGMFDTLNEFSSGFSAEQILNRSPSSGDDEDGDDDFFDYQDKTEPDRLLKPRNFTSNEYLGYVKESNEGINFPQSRLRTENRIKESDSGIDRNSRLTKNQLDEETESSDSESEEENIGQKGETLNSSKIQHTNEHVENSSSGDESDSERENVTEKSSTKHNANKGKSPVSGKIQHTNKHVEDSSSSDDSDSEQKTVNDKTSTKHNANKGKSQVSGKIQHTNNKIEDSSSNDDSELQQEIVNEKTSTKHQTTNNVKTPERLSKTNKKSVHTEEQSDGDDSSSSDSEEENIDQKRGGEAQKLVNKQSTNVNTRDLSSSGSSDSEEESEKINKTGGETQKLVNKQCGETQKLVNKTSGEVQKLVNKQSYDKNKGDSSSSSSSYSEEESDNESLSSKEKIVGVIAKPRNSSLLKAGVTRFCNNTEEIRNAEQDKSDGKKLTSKQDNMINEGLSNKQQIRNVEQDKSDGKKLPSKKSNNVINKESDSDSSSGEDEPEVLPNNTAMDKQTEGDDSCSSEGEMSVDTEKQTGAKYNKEKNSKAIVQADSESDSNSTSDNDDDKRGNRTKLEKVVQNDSSDDESSDEEIIEKKNSSTNPKSQNNTMNNEIVADKLNKSISKGKESIDKLPKNSSTLMKSPKEKKLNESTPKSNNDNHKITKIDDRSNKKRLKSANTVSESELKTSKSKNKDRSIAITNSTGPITDSVVNVSKEKSLKKDNSVKKSETPKTTEDREKKGQTPSTEEVEQRRLAAVKQKHKDNLKQAEAVKNALANIKDGPKLNKKVVFDEDSDEDIYHNQVDMQISDLEDVQNYSKNDKASSEDEEEDDDNNDDDDSEGSNDSDDDDDDDDIVQNKASTKKNKSNQDSKLPSDSSSSEDDDDDDDDDDSDDDNEDIADESPNETKKSGTQEQKLSLFDSSSSSSSDDDDDDDDDGDDERRFAVRPQFEGSSGSKLLELQASYGSDKRFHLDERFAESDSDVEKETEVVDDNNDEKQNALKILESVVGHKVTIEKKEKKKKSNFKDVSSLHYDPTREEHKEFELPKEQPGSSKKSKTSEETKETGSEKEADEEANKKMQERFYEVSDSFKKALTTESGSEGAQTFSLLQAFGAKGSDIEDGDGNAEVTEEDKLPLDVRFLRRPDKDFTDADDDNMEVDDLDKSHADNNSSGGPLMGKEDTRTFFFFFKDQDERMQESATKFHRTEDLEVIRDQWKKEKQAHIQRFKTKAKNFSRKKVQPGHDKHGDIFERRKIDRRLKNLHSKKK